MKSINKCKGFSLLELLIAIFLGLFLFEVILQKYLSAKNIYRSQDDLSRLSENVRFANFFLWQSIMQAGSAGCRKITELKVINNTPIKFAISNCIYGYDAGVVPEHLLNKSPAPNSDIIVINKTSSDVTNIVDTINAGSSSIRVQKNPATNGNRFLFIADCERADLIKTEKLGQVISFKGDFKKGYDRKNTEVRRFEELSFFVAKTTRLNEKKRPIYGLYFSVNRGKSQELIAGVNGMQVLYGVGDKSLDAIQYLKASAVNDWNKVVSVLIELQIGSLLLPDGKNKIFVKLRVKN